MFVHYAQSMDTHSGKVANDAFSIEEVLAISQSAQHIEKVKLASGNYSARQLDFWRSPSSHPRDAQRDDDFV
jgi:hypothetical protein